LLSALIRPISTPARAVPNTGWRAAPRTLRPPKGYRGRVSVGFDLFSHKMTDTLPTARSTLRADCVCLFVWCRACHHQGPADLQAIIRGQGD
jgi:hypothetical protein